jgi:hypothetical protein
VAIRRLNGHRFIGLAVIDSAFDLTRPAKANEGDGLGSAWFASPQEATHDFFDPTGFLVVFAVISSKRISTGHFDGGTLPQSEDPARASTVSDIFTPNQTERRDRS